MKVIETWQTDSKSIELLHEKGRTKTRGRWEFRVDGEVKMYGEGTPRNARKAVFTRQKLPY